jgi:hypothetical protein
MQSREPNMGIIDADRNPFLGNHKDWIRTQRRGLSELVHSRVLKLFGRTVKEIRGAKHKKARNEVRFPSFVAIRWGFAEVKGGRLIPSKKWDAIPLYDKYGVLLADGINKPVKETVRKEVRKVEERLEKKPVLRKFMNEDFPKVKAILAEICSSYAALCHPDVIDPLAPVTERDIVAEIQGALKDFCRQRKLNVHCEMKPADSEDMRQGELKKLPKIDVAILSDQGERSWLLSAKKIQDRYAKGAIEARFSSVPVEFFHTAIEVKIQSKVDDARKDLTILEGIGRRNPSCNCFFVLLNARGRKANHAAIRQCANKKRIEMIEYPPP